MTSRLANICTRVILNKINEKGERKLKMTKRAIIYSRVSTERQIDGYSLDNQQKECEEYCKRNNIEVVDVLSDEGISGKSIKKRTQLQKALTEIGKGGIDYLIVWKLSRLSRNATDTMNIGQLLRQCSANLISIKDNIDTSTQMGRMFLAMAGIFAEVERENIIVQVRGGMKERARCGYWNGGSAPLGYKLLEKELIICDDERQIVNYIYNNYLQGKGYRTIAEELNSKKYKTRKGNSFKINGVKDILTNPIYCGKIRWGYREECNKEDINEKRNRKYNKHPVLVEGIHEPIVTVEVFDKVQEKIKNNPRHGMRSFNGNHVLSGLIRCPSCGGKMSIHIINSKGKQYQYYTCNQYANKKECLPNQINKERIEAEFYSILKGIINKPDFKSRMLSAMNGMDEQIEIVQKTIRKKEREIDEIKGKCHKLVVNMASIDSISVIKTIEGGIESLNNDIKNIEDEIVRHKDTINSFENSNLNKTDIEMLINNIDKIIHIMDNETKQKFVRTLINKVVVGSDHHIKEIHFCYNESYIIENDTVNRIISK